MILRDFFPKRKTAFFIVLGHLVHPLKGYQLASALS